MTKSKTMSKKEFKKQLISFQSDYYNKELLKYEKYKADYQDIQRNLESVFEMDLSEFDLTLQRTFGDIAKAFAKKLKDKNTLDLRPVKLMELLELPIENIISSLDKLRIQKRSKPEPEDFKIYTSNEDENHRLKVAKDLIKLMPDIKTKISFQAPMLAPVKMDGSTLVPNQYYVKNNRI